MSEPRKITQIDAAIIDYQASRERLKGLVADLPEFELATIRVTKTQFAGAKALKEVILNFQPQSGWLAWQRCKEGENPLQAFGSWNDALLDRFTEENVVLEAELVKGCSSLQLKLSGPDEWTCIEVRDGDGDVQALVETTSYLGKKEKGATTLCYSVYWVQDEEFGFRPGVARLVGLSCVQGATE